MFCRKRNSSNKNNKHQRRNNNYSCWRNPFYVFLLTFCILGSLRFRDRRQRKDGPQSSSAGALTPFIRRQQQKRQQPQHQLEMPLSSSNSDSSTIVYTVIGQGNLPTDRNSQYIKYAAVRPSDGKSVTVREWAEQLSSEAQPLLSTSAIEHLTSLISRLAYKAVFFETPPVSSNSKDQPFEFVIVNAPHLYDFADGKADPTAFAEYFKDCHESSCAFSSLGKDALLIAPNPILQQAEGAAITSRAAVAATDAFSEYAHLTSFLRTAPSQQVTDTWRHAARLYLQRIDRILENNDKNKNEGPIWFSTSGMGISWLHFRLDSSPKYYTYRPYMTVVNPSLEKRPKVQLQGQQQEPKQQQQKEEPYPAASSSTTTSTATTTEAGGAAAAVQSTKDQRKQPTLKPEEAASARQRRS